MKNLLLFILMFTLHYSNAQSTPSLHLIPFQEVELSNNKSIILISKDADKTFLLIKDKAHVTHFQQEDVKRTNDFFKSKPYIVDYSSGADYSYKIYIAPGHEIEVMQTWLGFTVDDINKITQ